MAAAINLLAVNLLAVGLGPLLLGSLSDLLRARYGNDSLRYALLFTVVVTYSWAALHFLLSARTLREDFKRGQEANVVR
jgi:hypothetical protein